MVKMSKRAARLRYSFTCTSILGYLKDSNAAAHSVDTDIR